MDEKIPSSPGADEAAWQGLIESFRGPSATGRGGAETTPSATAAPGASAAGSGSDPRDGLGTEPTGATALNAELVGTDSDASDDAQAAGDSTKSEDDRWMSLFEEVSSTDSATDPLSQPSAESPLVDAGELPPQPAPAELGAGWRQYTPAEAPVEHFVPPEPAPLPETDAITRGAWLGVIGGPLLLVLAALFNRPLSGWLLYLALGGFVGGFCLLVWRMRDRDPFDDDNGAVV